MSSHEYLTLQNEGFELTLELTCPSNQSTPSSHEILSKFYLNLNMSRHYLYLDLFKLYKHSTCSMGYMEYIVL
jgi:hypothetical protein